MYAQNRDGHRQLRWLGLLEKLYSADSSPNILLDPTLRRVEEYFLHRCLCLLLPVDVKETLIFFGMLIVDRG